MSDEGACAAFEEFPIFFGCDTITEVNGNQINGRKPEKNEVKERKRKQK